MKYILSYLILTFLMSCEAALLCICCKETIGIFFNPQEWDDKVACAAAMVTGHVCFPMLAIFYWIYKLCTIGRR